MKYLKLYEEFDWDDDDFDFEEEPEINDNIIHEKFIILSNYLCVLKNKNYLGKSTFDSVWNVDKRYEKLSCYISFRSLNKSLYRTAPLNEINDYLSEDKLKFLNGTNKSHELGNNTMWKTNRKIY